MGNKQATDTTLNNITESCNAISSPLYTDTTPVARVGKLKGDASTIFWNTGNKYKDCGFNKLARLIEAFAGKGKIDTACTMLDFF